MNELDFSIFPILETERLILRQLKMSDDKYIFNYQSNKENFEFVDMPVYEDVKQAQNYIKKMNKGIKDNKWIIWAITDKRTDDILGTISIWNILKEKEQAELGYGLFPGNKGKGIMGEALNEVVKFTFNNMGLRIIEAYTNSINKKSISLLKRNNFVRVSDFTETETFSGKPMDMVIYQIENSK